MLKLGLLVFKHFWKFVWSADQRGVLSNHRSYCSSMCTPLIGPLMINFVSVISYSFHLRERAPLELEGSFCHNNSPSNYIIRQLDTGSCSKTRRHRAETITFRSDKKGDYPFGAFNIATFFLNRL